MNVLLWDKTVKVLHKLKNTCQAQNTCENK